MGRHLLLQQVGIGHCRHCHRYHQANSHAPHRFRCLLLHHGTCSWTAPTRSWVSSNTILCTSGGDKGVIERLKLLLVFICNYTAATPHIECLPLQPPPPPPSTPLPTLRTYLEFEPDPIHIVRGVGSDWNIQQAVARQTERETYLKPFKLVFVGFSISHRTSCARGAAVGHSHMAGRVRLAVYHR